MSLTEAPIETKLQIIGIDSGEHSKRKLSSMGIQIDNFIVKLNDTKWGPVLVKNPENGMNKLALGRHLAEKIIVKYEH